jgi:urease accessory protein
MFLLIKSNERYKNLGILIRACSFVLPVFLLLLSFGQRLIQVDIAGWTNGFSHPLHGWDHLLTMLAVGIWAAQMRGKAIWLLPLAFVSVMSLGGMVGAVGVTIPLVEGIILLSCAVFSVLITRRIRFSNKINVLIVAFFAFFHGFAHGQEISTSASLLSYTLGFMLATLLLHGAGILVAKVVVLAVTFFVSLMFSQVVYAKDRAITDIQSKPTSLTEKFNFGLVSPFQSLHRFEFSPEVFIYVHNNDPNGLTGTMQYSGVPPSGFKSIDYGFDIKKPDKNLSTEVIANEPNRVNSKLESLQKGQTDLKLSRISGHSQQQLLPAKFERCDSIQLLLHDFSFSSFKVANHCIAFTHYYPDINNSPGTALLSNGVGLNSPPLPLLSVLPSKEVSDFSNKKSRKPTSPEPHTYQAQHYFGSTTFFYFYQFTGFPEKAGSIFCNSADGLSHTKLSKRRNLEFCILLFSPVSCSSSSTNAISFSLLPGPVSSIFAKEKPPPKQVIFYT